MIDTRPPSAIERYTFDRLLTTLLFVAIGVAACLMPAQNDTWWQLRAGRDMWRTHAPLLHDTFSHTAQGSFWPNHEWLSQSIFYALYAAGGLPLLTLGAASAVVGAWAIVWRETPASPRTRILLIASVVVSACATWSPRPQVLSLLLTMTTIALLRARRYVWLPAVFLIWANLHGAVLIGIWLLGAAVPAAFVAAAGTRGHEDREARHRPWSLVAAAAISIAATLLTPLGTHFWTDILASLGRIRELGIAEWAAPSVADATLMPFWLMLISLAALAIVRGPRLCRDLAACANGHVTLCASALALAPLAVTASRNVPLFLMAAVPAVAALLPPGALQARALSRERPRLNIALAGAAAVAGTIAVAVAYTRGAAHLAWTPLPRASLSALDACPGNLYNRYDEGGYLIWFAPDRKVFLDGRQDPYSPALIAEQKHVETTGDYAPTFRRYGIGCAYVPSESLVAARLVQAGWLPLYRDAAWMVAARTTVNAEHAEAAEHAEKKIALRFPRFLRVQR